MSDFKDFEVIEDLTLNNEKQKSKRSSYWAEDLANAKAKQSIHQIHQNVLPVNRNLTLRTMSDSYTEGFLPFKSDPNLLNEYINSDGGIRMGKILEDLDSFASSISYKHCITEKEDCSDINIVTALVDRLDLLKPLPICDIRLSGHVSHAGNSSMEVLIKMEALSDEAFQDSEDDFQGETLMIARFIMVAKDPYTNLSTQINPLKLENDYQKGLFQIAEEQKARRNAFDAASLTKLPLTEEEKLLIHDCYMEYNKYTNQEEVPDHIVWMDETIMQSVTLMQPQKRNMHGFVFGGYLMKLAFELAISNASVFSKSQPKFLALDQISFKKPVQIGSILCMKSQVVYSAGSPHKSFQVAVTADVIDVEQGKRETTNVFHFTFVCDEPTTMLRRVVPRSYGESMKYIEGKRRREIGLRLRGLYNEASERKLLSKL